MELCVATDLSPSSRAAVDLVLSWAQKLGASVRLLHVVHDPVLAPALSNDVPSDVARADEALRAIAARAPCPCKVDVRTAEDVAGEVVTASKRCAYLFVGSQGKSAFERLRLGSIATAVLRKSHVPVVCIPHPKKGAGGASS